MRRSGIRVIRPHIAAVDQVHFLPRPFKRIMTKNIGTTDKVLRLSVACACVVAIATGTVSGTLALVLGIAAVALTGTALFSFCGLYSVLGITTCKTSQ